MKIRLQELDVFRGIAALLVVIFHYTTRYDDKYGHVGALLFKLPFGYFGVHFFFVISGFVIFMTIKNTNKSMDFIVSRFSRLYPAYWFAVGLTSILMLSYGLPDKSLTFSQIIVNLSMLHEFVNVDSVDGVYWTLTRELMFYAWILFLFKLGLTDKIVYVISAWLSLQLISSIVEHTFGYFPWKITFFLNLEYANLFSAGIIFYLLKNNLQSTYLHFLIVLCLFNQYIRYGEELTILLSTVYLMFYLFVYDKLKFICISPLLFLGSISYSLYLIHENIGFMLIKKLSEYDININIIVLTTIVLSILLASFITYKIERPANVWIRSRYKSRHNNKRK